MSRRRRDTPEPIGGITPTRHFLRKARACRIFIWVYYVACVSHSASAPVGTKFISWQTYKYVRLIWYEYLPSRGALLQLISPSSPIRTMCP